MIATSLVSIGFVGVNAVQASVFLVGICILSIFRLSSKCAAGKEGGSLSHTDGSVVTKRPEESPYASPWISILEASYSFGIPRRRLYSLYSEGAISGKRFGRVLRVSRNDLRRLLDDE
jgi:hypothetical protein